MYGELVMTRRQHPEAALQRTVKRYLDVALPSDCWWTTIPAGGGGKVRGAIIKGMGYKPGTPDIEIIWQGQAHFIELKAGKQPLSKVQDACHADLVAAGAHVAVCRSVAAVEGTLRGWGLPLRATTGARAA